MFNVEQTKFIIYMFYNILQSYYIKFMFYEIREIYVKLLNQRQCQKMCHKISLYLCTICSLNIIIHLYYIYALEFDKLLIYAYKLHNIYI